MIMVILSAKEWLTTGTERVSVTLGNPIYVAIYFLFNFFFTLILLYKDVILKGANTFKLFFKNWQSYMYILVLALSFFGVWITGTRGVILGIFGGIFIASLAILFFEKNNKLMRKISIIFISVIAIVVIVFFAIKNTQFVKNNSLLNRFATISLTSTAGGEARQYVWPMAIKGFKEKPILGWGQDGFNYVFNKYYDPRMYNQEQWFDRAHDTPLDILVAGGALGLITYLLIFIAVIFILWKKRNKFGVTESALILGLLAGYFTQNITVFDNLTSYMFFYVVLAYIYSKDISSGDLAVKNSKNPVNYEKANYVVAPILILVFGTTLWFANIKPIDANVNLINALQKYQEGPVKNLEYFKKAISYSSFGNPEIREQLLSIAPQVAQMQIDNTLKNDFVSFAFDQIQEQVKQTPEDARYQLFAGVFLDNIGQYPAAQPYLEKAVELSPGKQTMMFELSKNLAYQGKKAEALSWAKKAYELEVDFADAKSNYIAMAILNDQNSLVKELMGNATTTTSEIIIRAYLLKAQEFLDKGDKNSAVFEIQKAIKIAPAFKTQGQQIIEGILNGTLK